MRLPKQLGHTALALHEKATMWCSPQSSQYRCAKPARESAVQILVQFLRHKFRQRAPAGLVGPLLLEGQQVLLQHLIKGSLLRLRRV